MQNIMVLTNSINGLYSFRRELIEELIKRNFNVTISAPTDSRVNYFTDKGCKVIETTISRRGTNPFADFKLLLSYNTLLKEHKPDVVLTYTIKPNVYGGIVCQLRRIPQIVNITGLGSAVENKGILQKITLKLYRLGLRRAKCVFFQNKENMEFMQSYNIGKNNGRLIPGSGVNLIDYQLLEYPKSGEIHFTFISRIMKEKGIEQYLEAAQFIRNKYPQTVFHILGKCDEVYQEKLREFHNKGIIQYHGRQDDVKLFHQISHCTIHPTYYPEGMSNVLLESAACGRPVITTNRSGCKEIVIEGVTGYLVEQQNHWDLIEKVEKFISLSNDEKKKMGLAGRTLVEGKFDRRIVTREYIREIENIKKEFKDV